MTQFITSFILTILTSFLDYLLRRKPKLRYFYSTISAIPLLTTNEQETENQKTPLAKNMPPLGTHTIVISNQGNATAHNVRIGHYFLPPSHSVNPPMNCKNPDNEKEILIPALCPKYAVTISYLYPVTPNLNVKMINAYLSCDEGNAEEANLQHVNIKSPTLIKILKIVFYIGVFSIAYWIYGAVDFLFDLYNTMQP